MARYKLTKDGTIVIRIYDNGQQSFIPANFDNPDFQEYQKWIEEELGMTEPAQTQDEINQGLIDANNILVVQEIEKADIRAIRALLENDQPRIAKIVAAQKSRRQRLIPPPDENAPVPDNV